MRAGERFGAWKLVERLGSGGNGDVWKACHKHEGYAAIKVLRNSGRERRARFRSEIEFLLSHDPGQGVLPILDHSLPTDGKERAWYVMPLARLLRDALGHDAEVEKRVRAIHAVAVTLARLAARGIGHRDIKPENLFELDGEYLVGDFGLVTYPEKDPVTRAGRRVGPVDYIAPEMRVNADRADFGPADVYSLAKTTWVVLTGHSPPLPGPHRVDDEAYALGTYFSHRGLAPLDLLLERCTRHSASDRPTMGEVAHELSSWLLPVRAAPDPPQIRSVGKRIADLMERERRAQEAKMTTMRAFNQTIEALKDAGLNKFHNGVLRQARLNASYGPNSGAWSATPGFNLNPEALTRREWASIARSQEPFPVALAAFYVGELLPQEAVSLTSGLYIEKYKPGGELSREVIWQGSAKERVGSAALGRAVDELGTQLVEKAAAALHAYAEALEERESYRASLPGGKEEPVRSS